MLIKVLIGVAGVVVLILAVAATRSPAYHLTRSTDVDAPVDRVFGVLNDLRQFSRVLVLFGSTLKANDPDMQETFTGPAAGAGQSWAWSGKEAGQGSLTIEESVPEKRVTMKLVFVKPMASTASVVLSVTPTATGSSVSWSMTGDHNFIGKTFRMFMDLDGMLAKDIDKGLAELKGATASAR